MIQRGQVARPGRVPSPFRYNLPVRDAESIQIERFHWTETEERLRALLEHTTLTIDSRHKSFVSSEEQASGIRYRFTPPLLQAIPPAVYSPDHYLEGIAEGAGVQLMILLQAGACALGLWEDDALIRHKTIKKYVKRGHGKAQNNYLRTKGKSRYGSRLRLQNAASLLCEANTKICDWWTDFGPCRSIYYSAPVRLWPELLAAEPAAPFDRDDERLIKIPLDVRVPSFEELLRVRRRLERGELRRSRE